MISKKEQLKDQLKEILQLLKKYWILIVILVILTSAVGGVFASHFVTKIYYSTAKLYVRPYRDDGLLLSEDFQTSQDLTQDCVEIIESDSVLQKVIVAERLQNEMTVEQLKGQMYAYTDYQSRFLYITVAYISPEGAQHLVDAISNEAMKQVAEVTGVDWMTLVDKANYEETEEYPVIWKIVVQTIAYTLAFVFVIFIILTSGEKRLKDGKDVERYLHLEILGTIPVSNMRKKQLKR